MRGLFRVIVPIALVGAVVLLLGGVIQNLTEPTTVTTLSGGHQVIQGGLVASQEAIKELGTNGGGYFNANSAHPFENPNAFTNLVEIFLLLVIPFSLPRTYGVMVGDRRQGWTVLGFMATLWALMLTAVTWSEVHAAAGPLGGMEGKELRFGVWPSALFATSTTATSTGAVNSMHESFSRARGRWRAVQHDARRAVARWRRHGPLQRAARRDPHGVHRRSHGRAHARAARQADRSPRDHPDRPRRPRHADPRPRLHRYRRWWRRSCRRRCSPRVRTGSPRSCTPTRPRRTTTAAPSPGFSADTPYTNLTLALCMFLGRFAPIVLVLALAGSLVAQRRRPVTAGTLPTHTPTFIGLFVGVAVIVGGLTFFPALALGPLAEALS